MARPGGALPAQLSPSLQSATLFVDLVVLMASNDFSTQQVNRKRVAKRGIAKEDDAGSSLTLAICCRTRIGPRAGYEYRMERFSSMTWEISRGSQVIWRSASHKVLPADESCDSDRSTTAVILLNSRSSILPNAFLFIPPGPVMGAGSAGGLTMVRKSVPGGCLRGRAVAAVSTLSPGV